MKYNNKEITKEHRALVEIANDNKATLAAEYKREEELIENEKHKIIVDINEKFKSDIPEVYLIMSKLTIEYFVAKLNHCSNTS